MKKRLLALAAGPVKYAPMVGRELAEWLIRVGVDGVGPVDGAATVADEALAGAAHAEAAIDAVVGLNSGVTAATGFATGIGGVATLPLALPSDMVLHFFLAARTAGAIARLRGHDLADDAVRTAILLTVLGEAGEEMRVDVGADKDSDLLRALGELDAAGMRRVREAAGRRLVDRYADKAGRRLLVRLIPFAAAPVSGGTNLKWMRGVASRAKRVF